MNLYKLYKTKLEAVTEVPFKLEKDIQQLVEANLENYQVDENELKE